MRFVRFLLFILLVALGRGGVALAQVLTPTHLSTALSRPTAKPGDELTLLVNARIDPTWHLYATDFSEEVGPVVFTLKFAPSAAYKLLGKPESVNSHHEQDDVFKGEVAFWEKTGQIRQRIIVLQPGPLTIKAEADYQTCTDVDGRCVPGNETLTWGPIAVAAVAGAAKAVGAAPAAPAVAAPAAPTPVAAAATVVASVPAAQQPVVAPTVETTSSQPATKTSNQQRETRNKKLRTFGALPWRRSCRGWWRCLRRACFR